MSLYLINITVHVLAAFVWLGGLFFLGLMAPTLRRIEPAALRAELFSKIGTQFRSVGWVAIGLLLVTGVLNLHFGGVLTAEMLGSGAFWDSAYGRTLAWKIFAVTGIVVGSALHDFVYGPRASRAEVGSAEAHLLRRRASWIARVNALFGLILLIAAIRLARGI
jgi:putative copper export protein